MGMVVMEMVLLLVEGDTGNNRGGNDGDSCDEDGDGVDCYRVVPVLCQVF